MSLRPEIYGFQLAKLQRLLGSGQKRAVGAVNRRLDALRASDPFASFDEGEDDEDIQDDATLAKKIMERAIMEGAPFRGLKVEREPHVTAAVLLARHAQKWKSVGSNSWKMDAFDSFRKDVGRRLGRDDLKLLQYFCVGRPIFGKRIETYWSYYGYLTRAEVRALEKAVRGICKKDSWFSDPRYLDGFLPAFLNWLVAISSSKMDLWFFTE